MLHFLACDDKSCTRLKDLLDRIFLEGKAPHETASEWLQNRHKRQVRDTFEVGKLYFKLNNYSHNFFTICDFSMQLSIYTSCPIYHVRRVEF